MFRVLEKIQKKKKAQHTQLGKKSEAKRRLLTCSHTHRRTEHDARERALTAHRE